VSVKHQSLIAIAVIILLGAILQKDYINEFPSHIHAWAQSDRYAIAQGYVNNNLNFFKPETFVFNHQFPHKWEVPSKESITAVDFPIHDYAVGVLMKTFGTTAPWVFRIYVLLYSFIGLFYLYKLAKVITGSFYKSILVLIIGATSPVFVYYQSGFLPSVPSLANAFIGLYFYIQFILTKKNRVFNLSILFLTLGALSRTTFAIPLIAVFGMEFLKVIQNKSEIRSKLLAVVTSVSSIFIFLIYNSYLREKYGSIFLNHFMLPRSWQEVIEICIAVKKTWLLDYFSKTHYIVFSATLALIALTLFFKKNKPRSNQLNILMLIGVLFLGCIAFSVLMLRQFTAHDYYFLDTFYLPILLLFILTLSIVPDLNTKWFNTAMVIVVCLCAVPLVLNAVESQKSRRTTASWDRVQSTINNFKGASTYMDSIGIPLDAKILVIDAYAPNIPFLLMRRKGYALLSTRKELVEKALSWDCEYIIFQNDLFLSEIYTEFPQIISKIERKWDNGRISICSRNDADKSQTLDTFLGLDKKVPLIERDMDFDSLIEKGWQNTTSTSDLHYSGTHAGTLSKEMDFGLTFKSSNLDALKKSNTLLIIKSHVFRDSTMILPPDIELVVSINENSKNTYYKSFNLQQLMKYSDEWEQINVLFQLPKITADDYELGIYLWNVGKAEIAIDDFGFKIYE
jgi:hypothetical protein